MEAPEIIYLYGEHGSWMGRVWVDRKVFGDEIAYIREDVVREQISQVKTLCAHSPELCEEAPEVSKEK